LNAMLQRYYNAWCRRDSFQKLSMIQIESIYGIASCSSYLLIAYVCLMFIFDNSYIVMNAI